MMADDDKIEKEILSTMQSQRDALEANLEALRVQTKSVQSELAAARDELTEIERQRTLSRNSLVADVVSSMESVVERLKKGLDEEQTTAANGHARVFKHLEGAGTSTTDVTATAEAAVADAVAASKVAGAAAVRWQQDVTSSCTALGRVEVRITDSKDVASCAGIEAAEALSSLGSTALSWGSSCEKVASSIDRSASAISSTLEAQTAPRSRFKILHEESCSAAKMWHTETADVIATVERSASEIQESTLEMQAFRDCAVKHLADAEDSVENWAEGCRGNAQAFSDLQELQASHDSQDTAVDEARREAIASLSSAAEDVRCRVNGEIETIGTITVAIEHHVANIPRHLEPCDELLHNLEASSCATLDNLDKHVRDAYRSQQEKIKDADRIVSEAVGHMNNLTEATTSALSSQKSAVRSVLCMDAPEPSLSIVQDVPLVCVNSARSCHSSDSTSNLPVLDEATESLEASEVLAGKAVPLQAKENSNSMLVTKLRQPKAAKARSVPLAVMPGNLEAS